MLKQLALIAVALVMVLSAVSVASADLQLPAGAIKVGNYVMSQDNTTGVVHNLSFVNDNSEVVIASSIDATGKSVFSGNLSQYGSDSMKTLDNMTVFSAVNENTLFVATQSLTSSASITLNLVAPVSKVNLSASQQTYLEDHSTALAASFFANNMYQFKAGNTTYILFSNTNGLVASGNMSVTYTQNGLLYNNPVVGISSASALKDTIEKEVSNHDGARFSYNNTTGVLSGRFVTLDFRNGVISNFADNQTKAEVFSSISASGNGTIGLNNPSPVYPTSQPIVAGGVFFYGNYTAVYQIHNNPSMVTNFFLSNGTLNLTVANGLNISVYRPMKTEVEHEDLNSSKVNYSAVSLGAQYDVSASSTIVFVHNSTFRGSLFVHGGSVTVNNTTGTISIYTNGTAHVSFVAPPGLQNLKPTIRDAIQYAIDHGKLAAVIVLGAPGNGTTNLSVSYNSTMQVNIQNVVSKSVTVQVNSLSHEGTNFAIFVPNGVISNASKITLKFDTQTITLSGSMNSVVNATSTTQASFYYVSVSGGTLVIVHVPHFSTHTIQISTASTGIGFPTISGNSGLYLAIGIVGVIAVIAGVSLARRKK